jgi:hypothetical protein
MIVAMELKEIDAFARGKTVSKVDQITVGHVRIHFTDGSHFNAYMTINASEDSEYLSFTADKRHEQRMNPVNLDAGVQLTNT